MAEKAKSKGAKLVTRAEFEALGNNVKGLTSSIGDLVELMQKQNTAKPEETKEEKEVAKAGANRITNNADWEDIAREIIGEPVDHTEVEYLKGGGLKFTVVIKDEFSNAGLDYLERYKVDRRSKEIGAEGEAGVREWCEKIRNNLKGKPKSQAID